ncbi:MAG: ABC transporter ATP-binding protein, partial [Burkholderiaceae bacterium]
GVGKSTLLNCMAGLDSWDSGSVNLQGHNLDALNDDARALLRRQSVGFVFQAFHVLPHLDVAQNVALPLLLLGTPDPARVHAMLEAVGLGGLGTRLPQQLSGGQLQRVAMARALVTQPACVLADEPTGNLDRGTADGVFELMLQLARDQGTAFIVVTHDEALAQRCSRRARLVRGLLTETD